MKTEFAERIARSTFLIKDCDPFLYFLAVQFPWIAVKKGNELNVQSAGFDGNMFYYNEDYCMNLSDEELVFVVAHEACHALDSTIADTQINSMLDRQLGSGAKAHYRIMAFPNSFIDTHFDISANLKPSLQTKIHSAIVDAAKHSKIYEEKGYSTPPVSPMLLLSEKGLNNIYEAVKASKFNFEELFKPKFTTPFDTTDRGELFLLRYDIVKYVSENIQSIPDVLRFLASPVWQNVRDVARCFFPGINALDNKAYTAAFVDNRDIVELYRSEAYLFSKQY